MVFFFSTDCAMNISLPSLDSNVNCDLLASCTGVRCCVHASVLKRNYEIFFNIDHCSSSLSIQIEEVYHNKTLAGFQWGKIVAFYMKVQYQIHNVTAQLIDTHPPTHKKNPNYMMTIEGEDYLQIIILCFIRQGI